MQDEQYKFQICTFTISELPFSYLLHHIIMSNLEAYILPARCCSSVELHLVETFIDEDLFQSHWSRIDKTLSKSVQKFVKIWNFEISV
jgi:hypothetical protein